MKICSVGDCGSRVLAKGLCGKHYQRQLYTGTTAPRIRLKDELCVCGQRFAMARSEDGQALCQACYRRAQRAAAEPVKFVCARCGKEFASRFNKSHRTRYCSRECKGKAYSEDGRGAEAARRSYYKSRYGLTPEEVDAARQATRECEICGKPGLVGRWGNLYFDHDHDTGKVRGMLCSECNNALGKFHDDPAILQKAIDYLARAGVAV